jgi:hypothetical protein
MDGDVSATFNGGIVLSLSLLFPLRCNLFSQECIFILFISILFALIGSFIFIYTINCPHHAMHYQQVCLLHFSDFYSFVDFLLNLNFQYIFQSSAFCGFSPSVVQLHGRLLTLLLFIEIPSDSNGIQFRICCGVFSGEINLSLKRSEVFYIQITFEI